MILKVLKRMGWQLLQTLFVFAIVLGGGLVLAFWPVIFISLFVGLVLLMGTVIWYMKTLEEIKMEEKIKASLSKSKE